MKTAIVILMVSSTLMLAAQRNKEPKMEAEYSSGYFINSKGDTIRGEIQTNAGDEVTCYRTFYFKPKHVKKPKPFTMKQVKGYGFDDRHFIVIDYEGSKMFVERLTKGRIDFYEYRYHGKVDGWPAIQSDYFVKDTWAQGDDLQTRGLKKLSHKFYKKSLKPYMYEEQPMIWSDLDKYTFDKDKIVSAIREFNNFYAEKAN